MNNNTYALAYNEKNDTPLAESDFVGIRAGFPKAYYYQLLNAFGLGPFSFDEGVGSIMSMSRGREESKHVLNNLITLKLITYVG